MRSRESLEREEQFKRARDEAAEAAAATHPQLAEHQRQVVTLQKDLHAAKSEAAALRQKLRMSEAAVERAAQAARNEEKRALAAKLKAAPPERVAARVEARAAAKTAAQSLLVEKAKTASNRAASLAGSRLAALRVRGLYHAWVLPHVHLCVWKSFEQWRRSVLALVASARLRKLGQVASTATGAPVSTLLDPHVTMASIGSASHQRTPVHGRRDSASSPSLALAAAHQRGGPKAHAAAVARSSIRPPNAATPRGGAGPSGGAMPPSTPGGGGGGGRGVGGGGSAAVGDGAKTAEIRLAKAAAEQALAKEKERAAQQARASERALEEQAKAQAIVASQLRKTRVLLLHRSLSAALAQAALRWSLAAKARTLSHWRSVPIGDMGSAAGPGSGRRPPGAYQAPTLAARERSFRHPEEKERKLVPRQRAPRPRTTQPKQTAPQATAPPQTPRAVSQGGLLPAPSRGGHSGGHSATGAAPPMAHANPFAPPQPQPPPPLLSPKEVKFLGAHAAAPPPIWTDGHHATACQASDGATGGGGTVGCEGTTGSENAAFAASALAGAADALEAAVTPDYTGAAKARAKAKAAEAAAARRRSLMANTISRASACPSPGATTAMPIPSPRVCVPAQPTRGPMRRLQSPARQIRSAWDDRPSARCAATEAAAAAAVAEAVAVATADAEAQYAALQRGAVPADAATAADHAAARSALTPNSREKRVSWGVHPFHAQPPQPEQQVVEPMPQAEPPLSSRLEPVPHLPHSARSPLSPRSPLLQQQARPPRSPFTPSPSVAGWPPPPTPRSAAAAAEEPLRRREGEGAPTSRGSAKSPTKALPAENRAMAPPQPQQQHEPSKLAETLAAGLAALEAGESFDLVERALAEETAAAERAEQAALAAAATLLGS